MTAAPIVLAVSLLVGFGAGQAHAQEPGGGTSTTPTRPTEPQPQPQPQPQPDPQPQPAPAPGPQQVAAEPDSPDPPAPKPSQLSDIERPNLTRIYRGDDGGALYLRAEAATVTGFAEHPGQKYAFVFRGTRKDNLITGKWYDVAKNTRTTMGSITLKIFKKGDRLVRSAGTDFGPDTFDVISPEGLKWPGARPAGFQSQTRGDLDGAFYGKRVDMELDGSRQYWRENGDGAFGVTEGAPKNGRPAFVSVFWGKRKNGSVTGDYVDVPKGTEFRRGSFALVPLTFGRNFALAQTDEQGKSLPRTSRIEADYDIDFGLLAQLVENRFANATVGFGYAISYNGKVMVADGGGKSRLPEKGLPNGIDYAGTTQSPTASVTKLITATAVMKELEARNLSVATLAGQYLPDCWDLGPGMDQLTIKQLLDMTSGLFRPAESVKAEDNYLFQRTAAEGGLTGTKGYENMNYVMLGWVLAGMLDKEAVEASFTEHGCEKATKAYDEVFKIYGDYVLDMLADQGVLAGWFFTSASYARLYNFADLSIGPRIPGQSVNPTGGILITPRELGEYMADLEHGKFVSRATLQQMKDGEYGFDDLNGKGPNGGGPANSFQAGDLGLGKRKNGGCGADSSGRTCVAQIVMLPGDVQIIAFVNSGNNTYAGGNHWGLLNAWVGAIK